MSFVFKLHDIQSVQTPAGDESCYTGRWRSSTQDLARLLLPFYLLVEIRSTATFMRSEEFSSFFHHRYLHDPVFLLYPGIFSTPRAQNMVPGWQRVIDFERFRTRRRPVLLIDIESKSELPHSYRQNPKNTLAIFPDPTESSSRTTDRTVLINWTLSAWNTLLTMPTEGSSRMNIGRHSPRLNSRELKILLENHCLGRPAC